MELMIFYITAAISVGAALMAITRREAMHGILYLIVVLLAVAILFYLLGAPFLAALEVIVYAGAIVVLFLFVIMMVNPRPSSHGAKLSGTFGPLVFVAILAIESFVLMGRLPATTLEPSTVPPRDIGISLFENYAFGLHGVAILLLVGLIGAFYLGQKKEEA